MKKHIKYAVIICSCVIIFGTIGFLLFASSFELFDEPQKEIISNKCNKEGLRQATVFKLSGNATSNPSIHVSINLGCNGKISDMKEVILFTADSPYLQGNELEVEWPSSDTLRVTYDTDLRVFKDESMIKLESSPVNIFIEYIKKKKA